MPFWDKLKGLFPELKTLVDIKIGDVNLNFFSGNKKVSANREHILLNPDLMNSKEKRDLERVILEAIEEENYIVLQKDYNTIVGKIITHEQLPDVAQKIDFLREALKPDEFPIWRSGVALAKYFNLGDKKIVPKLKQDMVKLYGKRGGNIANICSAGYVENYLFPLYQDLKTSNPDNPENVKEKFQEICNLIVEQSAFAIFVCQYHTSIKLQEEIEERLARNSSYGIHFLNIHAIGDTNIKIVEMVLEKISNKYDVEWHQKTKRTIFGTITPKKEPPKVI